MLRFSVDLCFSFRILLTVDLYIQWRRPGRDVRMIIILTRSHKNAVQFRPDGGMPYVGGVANPTQTLHELLGIETNGTFTLSVPGIIHASIYTEATIHSKSLQYSTSDSVKTPSQVFAVVWDFSISFS